MYGSDGPQFARAVRAASHPVREKALKAITTTPSSSRSLSVKFGKPMSLMAYHLTVLADHDCIRVVRRESSGGSVELIYEPTPLGEELLLFVA